jgi:peptide/nickel transport system ATP-binding protein
LTPPRLRDIPDGDTDERAAASTPSDDILLEIRHLSADYGTPPDAVRAVNDVDLTLRRGQALGLAGESGSGKSTLAHALTRLLRSPASVSAGQVLYHPRSSLGDPTAEPIDVLGLEREELRRFRWQDIAIVFQSAMNALNPVLDIRAQFFDTLHAHRPEMSRHAMQERAGQLLDLVEVSRDRLRSYPHQLSGGMRQRVMIAIALALEPELIVMDEPTTALDVVTQRQILEQLARVRAELGFAMMFITHDLSLLLEIADVIAIMYAARIVEVGSAREFYRHPAHPYSAGLLHSFPPLTGPRRELVGVPGFPPDLRTVPPGCPFAPRCTFRMQRCDEANPGLMNAQVEISNGVATRAAADRTHVVACWLHAQSGASSEMQAQVAAAPKSAGLEEVSDPSGDLRREP